MLLLVDIHVLTLKKIRCFLIKKIIKNIENLYAMVVCEILYQGRINKEIKL